MGTLKIKRISENYSKCSTILLGLQRMQCIGHYEIVAAFNSWLSTNMGGQKCLVWRKYYTFERKFIATISKSKAFSLSTQPCSIS